MQKWRLKSSTALPVNETYFTDGDNQQITVTGLHFLFRSFIIKCFYKRHKSSSRQLQLPMWERNPHSGRIIQGAIFIGADVSTTS